MMAVYEDLDRHIMQHQYTVVAFGYDPYNAKDFVDKWMTEYGTVSRKYVKMSHRICTFGRTKLLASERLLLFDEELMKFAMGNSVVIEDNNGNESYPRNDQARR